MAEKNRSIVAARASDEQRRQLAERMSRVHISRIREMPRIELYLDQLLTLVSQELEFMQVPGETLVTGSMVNNYVKQGVVPAPRKKRYTRRHVAALVFVCAFKRVFTIAQVRQLMERVYASGLDLEALYDAACALCERALAACFSSEGAGGAASATGVADVAGIVRGEPGLEVDAGEGDAELVRLIESAVASLATKVYVEQSLLLAEGAGER